MPKQKLDKTQTLIDFEKKFKEEWGRNPSWAFFRNNYEPGVLTEEVAELTTVTEKEMSIIVYNDDVTTFDTVITALCEICKHDSIQAEQCANIVHNNGRCAVKNGSYKKLEPMCSALLERGITAVIE